MQIATYISDLLYRHECVVLPGYGAFISRRVPAQHFASSHTIYPPKKGLSFNAQIQQNDGLLVNYVATVESIPYQQAVQEVRNYVRFLDHELDTNGVVTIHKIGRFTRNEEQSLQFTPMYLVNYLPEAFGLTAHETYAVDRTPVETKIPVPAAATIELPPVQKEEIEETPVVPLHVPAASKTPWLRYAAIGAVLIGLSYVGFNTYTTQEAQNDIAVQEMADEEFTREIQEATFMISNPLPSIELEVAPVVKNYHIVAGAFRDPANADKKVAQLKRNGYDSQRIGVNKYGLHNVAFSSHADRNDAINELYRLRKQGFTGAWLLTGSLSK
ncbi:sporulation protein [Nonlabens arenilitoris]|uniref:Sporulation protein n=1 Tax=Nonlabens arenilitoris TaxID=1217969 RepID=A0A2S7U8W6_9FLAO|nr:SPOR domain-containing protein [Nonlabens arenilitoris]PQJ31376.1 sporulation protein [Nonlabens arenilitoris]